MIMLSARSCKIDYFTGFLIRLNTRKQWNPYIGMQIVSNLPLMTGTI